MKNNITVGSWMLLYDDISEENIMVKVIKKDDALKIATVEMDLAIRKTDEAKKYTIDVAYENLKQPKLRTKQKRNSIK